MRIRKNARYLTLTEKTNFVRAVLTLKNTPFAGAPVGTPISIYDYFVALHLGVPAVVLAASPSFTRDFGHGGAGFLAWHREYLLRFEQALQAVDASVTIPYWDWSGPTGSDTIFAPDFLGTNGGAGLPTSGGGDLAGGYFAFDAPSPLPGWWPSGLPGWRVRRSLGLHAATSHGGQLNIGLSGSAFTSLPAEAALRRSFRTASFLPDSADTLTALGRANFNAPAGAGFRNSLEGTVHSDGHMWFGFAGTSHMSNFFLSPNDPMFWLHHANIDRMWAMWQLDGHQGPTFYPSTGENPGHNLNNDMWPWGFADGSFALSPNGNPWPTDIPLPDHSAEPTRQPADVIDHRGLGYCYDTEVVLGVALDRSYSMTGVTPAPVTGAASNVSKWDAAKQAVVHLLQDCEAAYAAGEAYVVGGVLTFTTNSAGEIHTPVFPGTPFGVVKTAATYSAAGFTAAIGAQAPEGNTPLAGALNATETQLVRAPLPAATSDDRRYMAVLTDGNEYPAGPLALLPRAAFPYTRISAMGFGIGGGWDGINQATVDTLVLKGTAPVSGVPQSFFGGTFDALNKFFSNTVARAIGYTPMVDPRYELEAGHHVDTPFFVNGDHDSFMITAVGYDFVDDNWHVELRGPDGTVYGDTTTSPVLATFRRGDGKTTIFLSRNRAEASCWFGRWDVRVAYMPGGHDHHGGMLMPTLWDVLLPAGSLPVRGPIHSLIGIPAEKRQPVGRFPSLSAKDLERLAKYRAKHKQHEHAFGSDHEHHPSTCLASVEIFAKTRANASLALAKPARFAGDDIELVLELDGIDLEDLRDVVVAGRLVAPAYSIGKAYADLETIPPKKRERFIKRGEGERIFDEAGFLAEYERARPGVFKMRDESIELVRAADGTFRAHISGNRHPGVYRIGVYLEGTWKTPREQQMFSRLLNFEVSLGLLPDPKRSKVTLTRLTGESFAATFMVADQFGNMPSPVDVSAPEVRINGIAVKSIHHNAFTGEHRVEVNLCECGKSHELELGEDCCHLERGELTLECNSGPLQIVSKAPFEVTVALGGRVLTAMPGEGSGSAGGTSGGGKPPPPHDHGGHPH